MKRTTHDNGFFNFDSDSPIRYDVLRSSNVVAIDFDSGEIFDPRESPWYPDEENTRLQELLSQLQTEFPDVDKESFEDASRIANTLVQKLRIGERLYLYVGSFRLHAHKYENEGDYGNKVIDSRYDISKNTGPDPTFPMYRMVEEGEFNNYGLACVDRGYGNYIVNIPDKGSTLDHVIQSTLEDPENFDDIERMFMREYGLCQERTEKDIQFDPLPRNGRLLKLMDELLSEPFERILGVDYQKLRVQRNVGFFGKVKLFCKLAWDYHKKRQIARKKSRLPEDNPIKNFIDDILWVYYLVGRNLTDCYANGTTLTTKKSLQEAIIVQAHEQDHFYIEELFKERKGHSLFKNQAVVEGAARHFQVLMNEHLADKTGDERYRHALRELVLWDLAPLYFQLCKKHGKTPKVSEGEVQEIVKALLGRELDKHVNPYARGYAALKLEERSHSPEEIHKRILANDATFLIE